MPTSLDSTVLKARKLTKAYGTKVVVDDLSISVERGQIVGLLGPNGAGKTTTFGMLYGAVIPTAGSISIGGWDLQSKDGQIARKLVGVVTQETNLDSHLSVFENLIFFGRYCGLPLSKARARGEEILEQLALTEWRANRPSEISGGTARRVMLGRALIADPQIIFLDEPTTGLDPDVRQHFWKLIIDLSNRGKGILLTSHYMDEVERLCHRLILLQKGKLIDEGTPQEITRRSVGDEVIEVAGLNLLQLKEVIRERSKWMSPFSDGFLIALSPMEAESVMHELSALHPLRLVHRNANLEDVFIRLTGKGL